MQYQVPWTILWIQALLTSASQPTHLSCAGTLYSIPVVRRNLVDPGHIGQEISGEFIHLWLQNFIFEKGGKPKLDGLDQWWFLGRYGWKETRAILEAKYCEVSEALEVVNVRDTHKVASAQFCAAWSLLSRYEVCLIVSTREQYVFPQVWHGKDEWVFRRFSSVSRTMTTRRDGGQKDVEPATDEQRLLFGKRWWGVRKLQLNPT